MAAPASIPVPDELLEEIFIRLPTLNALALASGACTSFRRVIKARAFRRRFRALHRPPLLGFMDVAGFHPSQAPHPSAPMPWPWPPTPLISPSSRPSFLLPPTASRVTTTTRKAPAGAPATSATAASSSIGDPSTHVPSTCGPTAKTLPAVRDKPENNKRSNRHRCNAADFHLAVCDPLSSRYVLLPTIPEDLAAGPQDSLWAFEPVLAPATGDDGEDEPVKVICFARYMTKLVLFVFSSTTRQWSMVESPSFPFLKRLDLDMSCFDCVRGCFYWTEPYDWGDHLMVLDTRTMSFSTVDLLTGCHEELRDLHDPSFRPWRLNAVVAGRQGALEMFSLVCQHGSFALYHTSLQNNSQEWKLEKIINLPEQYHDYSISTVGAAEGFLFFQGAPEGNPIEHVDCYSMEVKTYEMTMVCSKLVDFSNRKLALPYFIFPTVLSEPTI
uniref:F-box domain-containing protein n=1 Tax=Aegilops tauschii subsp. strangulata TaxID=200361 RepID=A0A453TDH6_AEGTS